MTFRIVVVISITASVRLPLRKEATAIWWRKKSSARMSTPHPYQRQDHEWRSRADEDLFSIWQIFSTEEDGEVPVISVRREPSWTCSSSHHHLPKKKSNGTRLYFVKIAAWKSQCARSDSGHNFRRGWTYLCPSPQMRMPRSSASKFGPAKIKNLNSRFWHSLTGQRWFIREFDRRFTFGRLFHLHPLLFSVCFFMVRSPNNCVFSLWSSKIN